jgi:membrane protein implicated in regulation of membrane protease activity
MKKTILILAIISSIIAIIFTILPLDTIAFIPIGTALILLLFALYNANTKNKLLNFLLLIVSICSIVVLVKTFLIENSVKTDVEFEQQKMESNIESKKDLEDLEQLDNEL